MPSLRTRQTLPLAQAVYKAPQGLAGLLRLSKRDAGGVTRFEGDFVKLA